MNHADTPGMGGDSGQTPYTYPVTLPVDSAGLADVPGRFGLEGATLTPLGGDGIIRLWQVQAAGEIRILREYHPSRTVAAIAYEHEILNHLYARGWPVAAAYATGRGDTVVEAGGRLYALFPRLEGSPTAAASPAQDRIRGRLLARLHADLVSFPRRDQREGFGRAWELDLFVQPQLDSFNDLLESLRSRHPELATAIRREKYRNLRELAKLGYGEAPSTVVHAGFNPRNLLFNNGHLSGLLGFDSARRDAAAFDLAAGLVDVVAGDCPDAGRVQPFLSGYAAGRPLSPDEARLILPLVRANFLCQAMFWMLKWHRTADSRHLSSIARLVNNQFPALNDRWPELSATIESVAL